MSTDSETVDLAELARQHSEWVMRMSPKLSRVVGRVRRRNGVTLTRRQAKELTRLARAHHRGDVVTPTKTEAEPSTDQALKIRALTDENTRLRRLVRNSQRETLTARAVRERILELKAAPSAPPRWTRMPGRRGSAGHPTLLLSDLHWGEVVRGAEVYGLNEYNLEIAQRRLRHVVETACGLLRESIVSDGGYPGICVPLLGDMVSGDIHEELRLTNEAPILPVVLDLRDHLRAAIELLADEFGEVYVPCVTGNHGRQSRKPSAKRRVHTNYDWLLYCLLEGDFADDERVTFTVSEDTDVLYELAGLRFLATHGDSNGVRGGDGIIGSLGPIARGAKKTASVSAAIDRPFDVMLMGHWHTWLALSSVIVNGTLKGYDEYARASRFNFEPPSQGLFLTHPEHGVTITMPVYAEDSSGSTGD